MNGTGPLLRSVANAVHQKPSKIPHLCFHIASRRAQSQSPRHNALQTPLLRKRYQSTVISPAYVDRATTGSELKSDAASHETRTSSATVEEEGSYDEQLTAMEDLTGVPKDANMFDILEEGLRDKILSGLMSESIGSPFIRRADEEIFNRALVALDPDYFVEPFKEISRHTKGPLQSLVLQARSIDDRLATFAAWLDRIVSLRRSSGWRLNLEACNHLLKCAASMGDAQLAQAIFKKIMLADGVTPDLNSYNHYCKALVWSHAFSSAEKYNLRVIPRHLEIRGARNRPRGLKGYAPANAKRGIKGIRQDVLEIFKESMTNDYTATESTFISLMISMGREADLEGVKSILKSVWNIDVNLLGAYDEEEIESPTFYEEGHPLHPSEDLLFTVSHIFGANNDARMAWLLVDYISRNYNMRTTERVWLHLCEWTFLLTLRRTGQARRQGRDAGRVSQETFVQLVEVMNDAPHNIKPTTAIHAMLCRSWRDRHHLDKAVYHAQKVCRVVDQRYKTMKELADKVLQYALDAKSSNRPEAFACEDFYNLRRRYTLDFYEFQRDLQLMDCAVRRDVLEFSDWAGSGKLREWTHRKLPQLVDQFDTYLPRVVTYNTATGRVELRMSHDRRATALKKHMLDLRTLPRILNAMDTVDQVALNRRMEALPEVILSAKSYCNKCESVGHMAEHCTHEPFLSSTPHDVDRQYDSRETAETSDFLVMNPDISRDDVPYAFEPGAEKELARPKLPYQ